MSWESHVMRTHLNSAPIRVYALQTTAAMAGQGAKERLKANSLALARLRLLLWLALAVQVAGMGYRAWHSGSLKGVPSLLLTSAMGLACYLTIAAYAKPVYDEQGHLLDGGGDLSKGQVNGHAHDILYITAFVQIMSQFTRWAWYVLLLIPAFALYKLVTLLIIPNIKSSWSGGAGNAGEMQMDAAARKKLQRTEDRAERRRAKSFR